MEILKKWIKQWKWNRWTSQSKFGISLSHLLNRASISLVLFLVSAIIRIINVKYPLFLPEAAGGDANIVEACCWCVPPWLPLPTFNMSKLRSRPCKSEPIKFECIAVVCCWGWWATGWEAATGAEGKFAKKSEFECTFVVADNPVVWNLLSFVVIYGTVKTSFVAALREQWRKYHSTLCLQS